MKVLDYRLTSLLCALVLLLASCSPEGIDRLDQSWASPPAQDVVPAINRSTPVPDQYMVIFKDAEIQDLIDNRSVNPHPQGNRSIKPIDQGIYHSQLVKMERTSREVLQENRISEDAFLKAFAGVANGMLVKLNEKELDQLQKDHRIHYIEQDRMMALSDMEPEIKTPFNPSNVDNSIHGNGNQVIPSGVSRVGGSTNCSGNSTLLNRWAWILDTGIDSKNKELNVIGEVNFTTDSKAEDGYGHGTHVAGIIGAKNDGKGVVGVAAGASLINVKVLNDQGEGFYSNIVSGLNFASRYIYAGDVVNMSLGGDASSIIDVVIQNLASSGAKIVVAAGNDGGNVSSYSPARVNHSNVYIIAAMDDNDSYASFSNYGSTVDYALPGVNVLSTYGNNQYAYLSGTSMAAPHLSGLLITSGGNFHTNGSSRDPQGNYRPIPSH